MVQYGLMYLKRAFDFKGRSRRKEFWSGFLFVMLIEIILGGLTGFFFLQDKAAIGGILSFITSIASLYMSICGLACEIRRLHDIGKSGFCIFLSLIPIAGPFIILYLVGLKEGEPNANQYGPNPKDENGDSFSNNGYSFSNNAQSYGENYGNGYGDYNNFQQSNSFDGQGFNNAYGNYGQQGQSAGGYLNQSYGQQGQSAGGYLNQSYGQQGQTSQQSQPYVYNSQMSQSYQGQYDGLGAANNSYSQQGQPYGNVQQPNQYGNGNFAGQQAYSQQFGQFNNQQ